jgi:hypothetical protein
VKATRRSPGRFAAGAGARAPAEGESKRTTSNTRRPRHEYVLTDTGTALVDMLMAMAGWTDKWLAGDAGLPVLYRHHACGEVSHVDPRCAHCGEPTYAGDVELLPGSGAAA